jgi:hypothetical protein
MGFPRLTADQGNNTVSQQVKKKITRRQDGAAVSASAAGVPRLDLETTDAAADAVPL